jgi:tetratricopeptide (TPR) repeat protein
MQRGLSINGQRILLFQILSLMILISLCFTILANCDCNRPSDSAYPEEDQSFWYSEINSFLNCDTASPTTYGAHTGVPALNQTAGNNTANYWLNDANGLYLSGSYEQAVVSYAKALKLNSSLPNGWLNMGNSLYFLGRYQESLNAYNAVLNLEPKNPDALLGKKRALLDIDRIQRVNATLKITKT